MQKRRLGNSDLDLSILSLGTVALGMAYGITPSDAQEQGQSGGMAPPTLAEATRLIHRALEGGINFIDTASAYGRAEEVVGYALQDRRHEAVIATKINCFDTNGKLMRGNALRQHMQASIVDSLRLLRTDTIDLLMLHSAPLELLEDGVAVDMLQQFKAKGLARTIGASTYGTEAPRRAIELGVDALQVAYNILDQRMADEILPLAAAKGVGIIVRSVFLKGALTPRADDLPPHLATLKQQSEAIKQLANCLTPPLSRVEVALRFVLSQSQVTSALVGVRTEDELEAALRTAVAPPLSPST
ncbi:MAG: aldo/keto reductase, partial [Chloroflexota bacterium]